MCNGEGCVAPCGRMEGHNRLFKKYRHRTLGTASHEEFFGGGAAAAAVAVAAEQAAPGACSDTGSCVGAEQCVVAYATPSCRAIKQALPHNLEIQANARGSEGKVCLHRDCFLPVNAQLTWRL